MTRFQCCCRRCKGCAPHIGLSSELTHAGRPYELTLLVSTVLVLYWVCIFNFFLYLCLNVIMFILSCLYDFLMIFLYLFHVCLCAFVTYIKTLCYVMLCYVMLYGSRTQSLHLGYHQWAQKSQILTANISKTVSRRVTCQIGLDIGSTRAFQKCITWDGL